MVIGIDDLIGRFTNVMEDEVKVFCDRVLNYHLAEGSKLVDSSNDTYHPLWPIFSRDKLFQSSMPEDIVSAVRLFIESVMQDHGSVDEGLYSHQRAAQLKLDLRPKRRGKKNVATADGSQHSKFRVLQFQGHVLGAIASTLVWLRDAISSIVASSRRKLLDLQDRDSRANQSDLVRAHFDCSIMNDSLRFLTTHLPSLEADFDSILSEAVSSGVSLNSSYVAYFELLQQSAQRVASSIFEDILGIFGISMTGSDRLSQFTEMWMKQDENEENPFTIICNVSADALTCLRDWIHPQGFTVLLSDVFCNICTLLLYVAKEIALSKPDLFLSNDVTEDSKVEASQEVLQNLFRDISSVCELFHQFYNSQAEAEIMAKLNDITGVIQILYLSNTIFVDNLSVRKFFHLLIDPI